MPFGSCCIERNRSFYKMKPKYVQINGTQKSLIVNFEITQAFQHNKEQNENISYIFPNDFKMCFYDITFTVGEKIIKPKLATKEEALELYKTAFKEGKIAVYGSNMASGLTEFKLGNVPPGIECKVILKVAFQAVILNKKSFSIKFPLDVCTPSGSMECLYIKSNFSLNLQSDKKTISKVISNVSNSKFDKTTNILSISNTIVNQLNENSIILKFHTFQNIESCALLAPTDSNSLYDYCALTIVFNDEILANDPIPEQKDDKKSLMLDSLKNNKEFIFIVDCSGSMEGHSIRNASECLEVFIKSLPPDSYFNIICFGSSYRKLFEKSMKYSDESSEKAIILAQNLQANLGGTDIYDPLKSVFDNQIEHGQRKIFILTDGEVNNTAEVINLVSINSKDNQCCTIGLGSGCDAGLIEGIARVSGGKSDFIQYNESISEKVVNQLQSSMKHTLEDIEIHVAGENNDSFEISPYPLKSLMHNYGLIVFLRIEKSKNKESKDNKFLKGILVNGTCNHKMVEIVINNFEQLKNAEENEFGCSNGVNIGKAILPLFSFDFIQKYELMKNISENDKMNAIKLSLESGILCQYTGYIGIVDQSEEAHSKSMRAYWARCICGGQAPKQEVLHPFIDKFISDSENEKEDNDDIDDFNDDHSDDFNDDHSDDFDEFNLIGLLRLQSFDGCWKNIDDVNKMTGLEIDHIDSLKVKDKKLESEIMATLVAIAALRVFAGEKEDIWNLIEKKAISWLTKALPDIDIEAILNKVENSI